MSQLLNLCINQLLYLGCLCLVWEHDLEQEGFLQQRAISDGLTVEDYLTAALPKPGLKYPLVLKCISGQHSIGSTTQCLRQLN